METKREKREPRGGFTLVEVLIVLAILVMMAAMVMPRFLGARKAADVQAARTQIGMLQKALEVYATNVRNYPSTEQGLMALLVKPADLDDTVVWNGPYLNSDSVPRDPWGMDFHYEYPSQHSAADKPDIWSNGPNKVDDGGLGDDIVSWTVAR